MLMFSQKLKGRATSARSECVMTAGAVRNGSKRLTSEPECNTGMLIPTWKLYNYVFTFRIMRRKMVNHNRISIVQGFSFQTVSEENYQLAFLKNVRTADTINDLEWLPPRPLISPIIHTLATRLHSHDLVPLSRSTLVCGIGVGFLGYHAFGKACENTILIQPTH